MFTHLSVRLAPCGFDNPKKKKKRLDILESSTSPLSALCLEIYCRDSSCHVNINSFQFLQSLDVQTEVREFLLLLLLVWIHLVDSLQCYSSSF